MIALLPCALAAGSKSLPDASQKFLQNYCINCHDDERAKAKLSFESLPLDFTDRRWVRTYDKLISGEMPPKEKKQPSEAERKQLTQWLHKELYAASLAKQKAEGRVVIRRLNRIEYEHTLHDLLGIEVPLAGLLPEDNPVGGFDTVSAGLETSATHLVRYQNAADRALDAALCPRPVETKKIRTTAKKYIESRQPVHRTGIDPYVRYEGETAILCAVPYKHGTVLTAPASESGRYIIRASVRAVNSNGKIIPVLIGKISCDRFAHEKLQHIIDYRDAAPDKATLIEIETTLPQGEQIYFEGLGLPSMDAFKKSMKDTKLDENYKGIGLAIEWVELEGPLNPEAGYKRLFGDLPKMTRRYADDVLAGKPVDPNWTKWHPGEFSKHPLVPITKDPKGDAERLMRAFLPRAFRRPVPDAVASYFLQFVHAQLAKGERFEEAMRAGYKAALCSPYFLLLTEKPGKLDDYAIASRLSQFLWSSLPDEALFEAAAKGELSKPDVLRAHTERMLNDPKSARLTENFTGQWLDLRKFHAMKPDDAYFEYDDTLAWSMPLETTRFFEEVLRKDLPVTNFFHSEWTFLNSRLGKHYGIPGCEGLELRKVTLPPNSHRGGVITHASVLKLTTNATYTSPVKRGAWVLERIIGKPPSPPPPDVPAIEPDIRGAVTIREQLEKHKNVAVCASCHLQIDPPGFALESFDVVGGWREFYRVKKGGDGVKYTEHPNYPEKKMYLAKPVEPAYETDTGEKFQNIDEYKKLILKNPDQLAHNMVEKLMVYATGAEIQFADREVLEHIVKDVRGKNYGLRAIIHAIVQSRVFLHK
ncbi:MAG TPA: DUF1592 domain-containing protein [Planctomycetota bacterium]|nr:DUF1592 domain-containing protein [Planctomycetota bacterium]